MLTTKRSRPKMESSVQKRKRQKPVIKLEDAPRVKNIRELAELGKSFKFYRNIDSAMLWRISPYLEDLDNMIGMTNLKETLFCQVTYYLQGMQCRTQNEDYLHTVIYGPPGTGKTTVAKIIARIYQAMGILSPNGKFTTAYRDDFIAGYLGQTAGKTRKLLESCIGGVLFIDEVYSLAPRNTDKDSFSKEAIDTLTGFLSDNKNNFCCIVAGYEEEIRDCFFAMNKGLERRFPWVHKIPEYTDNELYRIFERMIQSIGWHISFDNSFGIDFFRKNRKFFKNAGGDIETFISKCKMLHSKRVFGLENDHKFVLTEEDLENAIEFTAKNNTPKEDKPPEHMYI